MSQDSFATTEPVSPIVFTPEPLPGHSLTIQVSLTIIGAAEDDTMGNQLIDAALLAAKTFVDEAPTGFSSMEACTSQISLQFGDATYQMTMTATPKMYSTNGLTKRDIQLALGSLQMTVHRVLRNIEYSNRVNSILIEELVTSPHLIAMLLNGPSTSNLTEFMTIGIDVDSDPFTGLLDLDGIDHTDLSRNYDSPGYGYTSNDSRPIFD